MTTAPSHPGLDPRPERIGFVLVEPSLCANIGATARAMKTMGLSRLALVQPRRRPGAEAIACASGADDLLASAAIHDDLVTAVADCRLVIGSSARPRSVQWPTLDPRACAQLLCREAAQGEVALLLGRERSGLANEELARCHYLVQIPSDPSFSSLNIAAAAQIFAYEIRQALLATATAATTAAHSEVHESPLATAAEMEGFFTHLTATLIDIGYADPAQSQRLQRRLRRLFNRARPDRTEINILRGILRAATNPRQTREPPA